MNHNIIENLGILTRYYKKVGDQWRQQAYQRAIISIKGLNFEITSIKQVKGVEGIGKSIRDKIKEYLDTGQIRKVEEVKVQLKQKVHKDKKETVLELFQGIWGVGPAKARELYTLGMRNLDDIRANQDLLNTNQRIGLKYYQDLLKPIPREYIDVFQMAVRSVLTKEFGMNSYRMQVAGSYRRGAKTSGDIDVLITSKKFNLEQMVMALTKWDVITDTMSMRSEKFMGIAHYPNGQRYHFRMDIEFLPEDEYYMGLLYFTGSKGFNVAMRAYAKRLGCTLNQHGLFDQKGNRIPVYTEAEVFDALNMKYIPPNER
jgi:DNA polymerase/3'-5' exonuclease PolX